jgi:hypothetical protein
MTVPDWTERVRPALNSRHLSILLTVFFLIANALALFLADDVARKTPFFSNIFVWWIAAHIALGLLLALSMTISLWQWQMEQLGLVGVLFGFGLINLLLCSYVSIATYSAASVLVKVALWGTLLTYLFWFGWRNFVAFSHAWSDEKLRLLFILEKSDHFIFFQLGEIEVRKKINFKIHCHSLTCLVFILAGLASYLFRFELATYFEVNWIPLAYAIAMAPIATLGVTMITLGWQYIIYSRHLAKETGKSIYLNNISKLK